MLKHHLLPSIGMRLLKHPLLPSIGMRLLKHPLLPSIGMSYRKHPLLPNTGTRCKPLTPGAQFIVSGVVSSHALSPTPAPLEGTLCPCIPAIPLARLSKLTDSALDAFFCSAGPGFRGGPLFLEVLSAPRNLG